MLGFIVVGVTLAIMGIGGPFFIKAAYGSDQAKLFLLVFSFVAPAIVLLLIGTSYSSLHWLAVVAVAVGVSGLIWVRRLVNNGDRY
jgi:hypothetical protein